MALWWVLLIGLPVAQAQTAGGLDPSAGAPNPAEASVEDAPIVETSPAPVLSDGSGIAVEPADLPSERAPDGGGLVELVATVSTAPMEVGTVRRVGLGAAVGIPTSLTAQVWVRPRVALSAHIGPTLSTSGLSVRVQAEGVAMELAHWPLGRLRLLGHGGLDVIALFGRAGEGLPVRFGVHGGAGVDFVPRQFPITAFAEVAPVFYPLDVLPGARFTPVGINVAGGLRLFLAPPRRSLASDRGQERQRVDGVRTAVVADAVGGESVLPVPLDETEAAAPGRQEAVPVTEPGDGGVSVDHPVGEAVETDPEAGNAPVGDVGGLHEDAGHGVPPVVPR